MKPLIIAGGSDGIKYIPYEKDYEIWGITDNAIRTLKRFDVLFDPHKLSHAKKNKRLKNYYEILTTLKQPIYMRRHFKQIPSSIQYPRTEIVKKYGELFFSSFDYMMALAIHLGYKEIYIYGIDMAVQQEYLYQRPSAMYWVGIARGSGIKVTIQKDSGLNMTGMYALHNSNSSRVDALMSKVYKNKAALKDMYNNKAFTEGMIIAINNLVQVKDLNLNAALVTAIGAEKDVNGQIEKLENEIQDSLVEMSNILKCGVIIPENEVVLRAIEKGRIFKA
jgi:hypothetical protein